MATKDKIVNLEDLKVVGDEVSYLKGAFTDGYIENSGYLQGYRDSNFNVITHTARCTTSKVFHLYPGDKFVVEDVSNNFQFVFQGVYNGAYVVNSGWYATNAVLNVTNEGYYFINIGKGEGDSRTELITPSDVTLTVKAIPKTAFALDSDLDYLVESIEVQSAFYTDTSSYGTAASAYSPTTVIPAGAKTLSLEVYCVAAGTIEIGLWNISTNAYYGNETFTVNAGLNTLIYHKSVSAASRLVFNATNKVRYVNGASGFAITDVTISNSTVTAGTTLANFGLYATLYYFKGGNTESNALCVGQGQEYATINNALSKAYTLESITNPITIIVYPGVYDEVLNINGTHYISIVGINRDDCVLKNGSADYNKAPLRISGQAYIANMTIIETAEDYVSTHGEGTGKTAWKTDTLAGYAIYDWLGTNMAYAVHCDDATNGETTICRFENCKIYSECGPAFGSGMQTNQSIELVNCEIESNIDTDVYNYCATTSGKGAISQGTLLCHGKEDGTDMHLLVKNCTIKANVGRVLYMYPVGTNNDATAEFIGNAFYSDGLGSASEYYKITFDLSEILGGISNGNNIGALNKGIFAE